MADVDVELGNTHDSVRIILDWIQNSTNKSSSATVHMIPSHIRQLNPSAFDPRVVSIGPLHRNDESLLSFERQKAIFVHDLLSNTDLPPKQTLKKCLSKVNVSIDRIKVFYDLKPTYNEDEIVRMMVMDGCFILEYIYKSAYGFGAENMVLPTPIAYDLLLIENQIPFFVLQDIFECTSSRFTRITSVIELVSLLVQVVCIFESNITIKDDTTPDHILGLIHECYRAPNPPPSATTQFRAYSVTDLDRAGVNFKPHHEDPEWLMAMKLELPSKCLSFFWPWAKPTLRMPKLYVTDDTELIIRNLIAYEQFTPKVRHHITAYALTMDRLINTEEDVSILVESKVVNNSMDSNKEAAKMINQVCDGAYTMDSFYYTELGELDTYFKGTRSRSIAWLNIGLFRRTYCSSPWSIIALLAGTFLLILTTAQTYFTIKPVKN